LCHSRSSANCPTTFTTSSNTCYTGSSAATASTREPAAAQSPSLGASAVALTSPSTKLCRSKQGYHDVVVSPQIFCASTATTALTPRIHACSAAVASERTRARTGCTHSLTQNFG
jgi:hypothetical protein